MLDFKKLSLTKDKTTWLILFFLVPIILFLGLRGLPGNPSIEMLNSDHWSEEGPLELSPERGRFALLYSVAEEKSLHFSLPVAQLATPDLAYSAAGEYVSMFAPGVSFLVLPGYLVGKMFGAAQAGAFAVIALFALANVFLVRSLALRLGARPGFALLGALSFGLATPAFAYGVNLYQHHVTTFLLLSALYALWRFPNLLGFAYVWFAAAFSVVVDNPNLFLMFPLGLLALGALWKNWRVLNLEGKKIFRTRLFGLWSLLALLTMIIPAAFFFWYNSAAYGNPLQLPGTLQGVDEIGPDGQPATVNTYEQKLGVVHIPTGETSKEKTAIGFFNTRNLYDGFYSHFLSPDRGIIYFTPVMLLGLVGFFLLYRRSPRDVGLLMTLTAVNVLTYSLWGDPQGGWAFGSRYLVPSYALLAVGLSLALTWFPKRALLYAVFCPLLIFSLWVNTLGALTSSANPPKVEVLALEKQSGHEEKYTFMRNWEFLHEKYEKIGSKSFVYQAWAKGYLSAVQYFFLVFALVLLTALVALSLEFFPKKKP